MKADRVPVVSYSVQEMYSLGELIPRCFSASQENTTWTWHNVTNLLAINGCNLACNIGGGKELDSENAIIENSLGVGKMYRAREPTVWISYKVSPIGHCIHSANSRFVTFDLYHKRKTKVSERTSDWVDRLASVRSPSLSLPLDKCGTTSCPWAIYGPLRTEICDPQSILEKN
uniref:Uncharacterized protein n=1 Tax=Timema cristinae TaxID=61476 RepID=A0A7R9GT04_TIMCR|nr:unnamed protein product [Timema cristinae]